jgi:arginine/ornithine transport system substrate-binding protein
VELGNAVCTEIKAKGKWISQAWDGMIPSLLARKYDAVMSSMAITEQRAKKGMSLDFS